MARDALGAIADDYPSDAYEMHNTPLPAIILGVLDDVPLVSCPPLGPRVATHFST